MVQILLGKLNRETNSIEKEFCLYKPIDDLLSYQMINIAPSEYDFNVPITYCALKKDHEDKLTLYVETQHEKVKIPLHHKCFNYAYPDQIQHAQFNQNIFYVIFSLACIIGAHKFSLFSLYIKGIKSIYNSVQSTRTLLVNKYKLWIKTKKPLTNFNIFNRFFFKKLVK